jgi:hypothetical protein
VIGLAGEGAISSQVTFGFYARAISIRLTDISGGTIQGGLSAKWYFTDNVGIGGGVDVTSLRIKKYVKDDTIFSGPPPVPVMIVPE